MTVNEAHLQFKLGCDKVDSLNSPNFLDEEIDFYLSDAQEQYIDLKAYGNFKNLTVEETEKRIKDLQSITKNVNISTSAIVSTADNQVDGRFVPLPTDYRYPLSEQVTITYTDCNNVQRPRRIPVYPITHDQYNTVVRNPFTKPNFDKAYRLPYGRINGIEFFEIIPASNIVFLNTYHLRYLKNPAKIDKAQRLTPPGLPGTGIIEMTDEICREIIKIAVRNAMGDTQNPGVQEQDQRINETIQ